MNMKKITTYLFILIMALAGITTSSCRSRKEGCPINDSTYAKPNKKGKFKKSRTKSGLFPKKMRKKVKAHR